MKLYRKKPVVVEAVQFIAGEQDCELSEYVVNGKIEYKEDGTMLIDTFEGTMQARPGDWIIKGVKGELELCKPDIFKMTYDLIDQHALKIEMDELQFQR